MLSGLSRLDKVGNGAFVSESNYHLAVRSDISSRSNQKVHDALNPSEESSMLSV